MSLSLIESAYPSTNKTLKVMAMVVSPCDDDNNDD
jgi:hypothetical protein